MKLFLFPFCCLLLAGLLVPLVGCGKKPKENEDARRDRDNNTLEPDELEVMLKKQEVICDQGKCPSYLTKIAIKTRENTLKFCTGILTDSSTIATSTSCLPDYLRAEGLGCEKDIHFFLEGKPAPLRVGCKSIRKISNLDGKDPVFWRSDVAFLQTETKVDRDSLRASNIVRMGMKDMSDFVVWTINAENDFVGRIRKSECQAVHNTYFNPFSNNESSPGVTLAGCPYEKGNSGSPVLDYRGRLRGMVSRPVDNSYVDELRRRGILETTLKPIIHSTNFACAPTIYDEEVQDFEECTKKLEESLFFKLQLYMISIEELFRVPLIKLETSLNEANRYISVKVISIPETHDSHRLKVEPKCFKNVSRWIGEFTGRDPFNFYIEIPEKVLKRSMDEFGRIKVYETDRLRLNYTFQFHPRILKNTGKTTITVFRPDMPRERDDFPNITENCSLF